MHGQIQPSDPKRSFKAITAAMGDVGHPEAWPCPARHESIKVGYGLCGRSVTIMPLEL